MRREEMLRKVQMLGFVVTDVHLFLNTHPSDMAALRFYHKYSALYRQAAAEYEAKFGPLIAGNGEMENGWDWIENPWPWELEG